MNPRALILMIIAGLSVVAIIMMTRSYLSGLEQDAQVTQVRVAPKSKILVAAKDLPAGTIIIPEHLSLKNWPKDALNSAYYSSDTDKSDLAGKVVRTPFTKGAPITKSALVSQGERGFMAAILRPDMRAVTVKINAQSGVGGFLFPGDRVDVILTHQVEGANRERHIVSETILENVRILGVDQRSESTDKKVQIGKSATLEVTPTMAEKVSMLKSLGTLSLALRSLAMEKADIDTMPTDLQGRPTFGSDVSKLLPVMDADNNKGLVVVVRGSSATTVETGKNTKGKKQ